MDRYPLTFGQQRYFTSSADSAELSAKAWLSYDIHGPLNVQALVTAVRTVLHRHDALRLRVMLVADGDAVQWAADPDDELPLVLRSVHGASTDQFRAYVDRILCNEASTPWAHEETGPSRYFLLRYTENHHAFLAVFSHAAVDGRSLTLLERDIWSIYRECAVLKNVPDQGARYRFLESARRMADRFSVRSTSANAEFWRYTLDRKASLRALSRLQAGWTGDQGVITMELLLDEAATTAVRADCRRLGCTEFQILLTRFASAYVGALDAPGITALVMNDLRARDDQDVVGMFVNRLPVVLEGEPTVDAVRNELLRMKFRGHVPPSIIGDCYDRAWRDLGVRLADAVTFTYVEHESNPTSRVSDLDITAGAYTPATVAVMTAPLLDVVVHTFPREIRIGLTFNRSVFRQDTAHVMVDRFARGLR